MNIKNYLFASISLLLVLTLAGFVDTASAQEDISLETLTIQVWPEYDQPSALVFYIGEVAAGTTLPATLRFQLPPGAALNAAAYVDEQTGNLLTAVSAVDGNVVTMTSPSGSFHIEFYDPGLKVNGEQRTYSLMWQGDYPVAQLTLEVEQPVGARDMAVEPAGGSWTTSASGLQAYVANQGALQAGQQATVSLSYAKTGSELTVDSLSPTLPGNVGQPASTPPGNTGQVIGLILLSVILLLVIGGTAFYFLRRRRETTQASPAAGKRFCTQCGQAISARDRFCRHCGAKVS